jgi:anti-anti-sigma regulatory factor
VVLTPVTSSSPSHLDVTTRFDGPDAVLALRGTVESGAALELGAVLNAVIDRRPASLVLDLSALDFMGADAVVAVANAEKRLAGHGTKLTVHSPTVLLNRLLDLIDAADASPPGEAVSAPPHRRDDVGASKPGVPPADRRGDSPQNVRHMTAMPANPDVIDGALGLVVELAKSCVGGADGVSVSLLRHGVLSTVAASDETVLEMDADQYATGEGPCLLASVQGRSYHAESLDSETRWPNFTPKARGLGIRSILSSPLKASDQPVGALNIYSRTASAFDAKAEEMAALFAQKASVILSDGGAGVTDGEMAIRFQEALRSREVIALARGILMEREGVDEDGAFEALLRLSLYSGESLRGRAETMVLSARQPEVRTGAGHGD